MSYPTHQAARSATITATLACVAMLGACSPGRTAGITQSENQMMLEDIGIGSAFASNNEFLSSSQGPNLIAGDWLAVQCASAGGYFDNYNKGQSWAPVYANVETDD